MRVRPLLPVLLLLLTACGEQRPPTPTAEEAEQLDEAEALLNAEQSNSERQPTP